MRQVIAIGGGGFGRTTKSNLDRTIYFGSNR